MDKVEEDDPIGWDWVTGGREAVVVSRRRSSTIPENKTVGT